MACVSLEWSLVSPFWQALSIPTQSRLLRWCIRSQSISESTWETRLASPDPDLSELPVHAYLSVEMVAAYWRVPRSRVYAMVADGQLAAIHLGATIRIPRTAVMAFAASPATSTGPAPAVPEPLMATCWDALAVEDQWSLLAWLLASTSHDDPTLPVPASAPKNDVAPGGIPEKSPSAYLSIRECATMFAVHPSTIRQAIKSGAMPSITIGTQIRIPREALAGGAAHG